MLRSFLPRSLPALLAAALIGLAFIIPSDASARPGGGGFRGGGGFHGGAFRGGGFRGGFVHGPGFRHFGHRRFLFAGAPFLYGAYVYPYGYGYNDCLAPRRIWTAYGWRIRWVNVCY